MKSRYFYWETRYIETTYDHNQQHIDECEYVSLYKFMTVWREFGGGINE